jgi:hypothetical protein
MSPEAIRLAIIASIVMLACVWCGPSQADLDTCQAHGQSLETCVHSVMP